MMAQDVVIEGQKCLTMFDREDNHQVCYYRSDEREQPQEKKPDEGVS